MLPPPAPASFSVLLLTWKATSGSNTFRTYQDEEAQPLQIYSEQA